MSVHPVVYILVVLFGSSSWLSVNSIWMELSLLTQTLPEGWSLPSYLAAVVQIACIGPLVYAILHKFTRVQVPQAPTILCLLLVCTLSTLLLALMWDVTSTVFGVERSAYLIGITFIMALINATSNLLFMPYMASFHPSYLTAYFVGMGFSALVPSIVSLVQGTLYYECVSGSTKGTRLPVYSPARFDVSTYNYVMLVWMCFATASFVVLHWFVSDEHKDNKSRSETEDRTKPKLETIDELAPLKDPVAKASTMDENQPTEADAPERYWILLICLAIVCAQLNSIIPSVQSFASLPYSMTTYHLSLTVSNLTHPLTSFLPLWTKPRATASLVSATALSIGFAAFVVYLAFGSPTPLLYRSTLGAILSVISSVFASSLSSYLRTVITAVIREDSPHNESRLFWCGVTMQVGSFLGACIMFPLVNVFNVFRSADLCG